MACEETCTSPKPSPGKKQTKLVDSSAAQAALQRPPPAFWSLCVCFFKVSQQSLWCSVPCVGLFQLMSWQLNDGGYIMFVLWLCGKVHLPRTFARAPPQPISYYTIRISYLIQAQKIFSSQMYKILCELPYLSIPGHSTRISAVLHRCQALGSA